MAETTAQQRKIPMTAEKNKSTPSEMRPAVWLSPAASAADAARLGAAVLLLAHRFYSSR